MAFFDRKVTVESILKDISKLSDEDKAKVLDGLKPAEDTEEQVAEAEEDIEEKGEDTQTEKDRIDESVAAQEENAGDEDTQSAQDRVDEAEGEEAAQTEEQPAEEAEPPVNDIETRLAALEQRTNDDATEALAQRIAALEERLGKVVESLDDKPFGAKPEMPEGKDEEMDDDDRIMRSYYGRSYRR